MATKTEIINMALVRCKEKRIDSESDNNHRANTANAVYTQTRDEAQAINPPEHGWRFCRKRYQQVDLDSHTISAFADYSGTVSGAVLCTTATSHNLTTGDLVEISDTTNYDGDHEVTRVSTTTFYFTDTWVADDATGTAQWVSEEYLYRFKIPSSPVCLRVDSVQVEGVELTDWEEENGYILTNLEDDEIDIKYIGQEITEANFPIHFISVFVEMLAAKLALALSSDDNLHNEIINELHTIVLPNAAGIDERSKYVREQSSSWVDIGRSTTVLE